MNQFDLRKFPPESLKSTVDHVFLLKISHMCKTVNICYSTVQIMNNIQDFTHQTWLESQQCCCQGNRNVPLPTNCVTRFLPKACEERENPVAALRARRLWWVQGLPVLLSRRKRIITSDYISPHLTHQRRTHSSEPASAPALRHAL